MHHDHEVVDGAVRHQQLPVAIIDHPAGWDGGEDVVGVILGTTFVVVASDLQEEEPHDEDPDDDDRQ